VSPQIAALPVHAIGPPLPLSPANTDPPVEIVHEVVEVVEQLRLPRADALDPSTPRTDGAALICRRQRATFKRLGVCLHACLHSQSK
jgi:hypothetical protein